MAGDLGSPLAENNFRSLSPIRRKNAACLTGETFGLLLFSRMYCGARAKRFHGSLDHSAAIDHEELKFPTFETKIGHVRCGASATVARRVRRVRFDRRHHHWYAALPAVLTEHRLARLRA